MKNTFLSVLLSSVSLFSLSTIAPAQNWKETRSVLSIANQEEVLQPGQKITTRVKLQQTTIPTKKLLRVKGYGVVGQRGETTFRINEGRIDNSLDKTVRRKEKYSLYFKGENDDFEQVAFNRISHSLLQPGELSVTLPVIRKRNLQVDENGEFGLRIELFMKKEGRFEDDVYDEPDSVLFIPIPEGDSGYQKIQHTFTLPENIACLMLQVGGTKFAGECWLESPQLRQQGKLIASIPFEKVEERSSKYNYWVGVNLSTTSWPLWQLKVNGKQVFKDVCFDRASHIADFYIPLPGNVRVDDELELTLVDQPHRQTFPYKVLGLEVIEESARDFEVVALPKFVRNNAAFGALIETNEPNVIVNVEASENIVPRQQQVFLREPGLHVVEMRAGKAGEKAELIFRSSANEYKACIAQVLEKENDHVYISSGDDVYFDKTDKGYSYFFKWYLANRIGNWLQFRPSYQWSGFRKAAPDVIGYYVDLLDKMKMPYAWQVEGRTLAASKINPSLDVLNTPSFQGKQAHENDGGYYYWQHFKYNGLYADLAARTRPLGGIFAKHRPIYTDHGNFIHYDTKTVKDMQDGAQRFVNNLRYSKGESTRHTGPSTSFRYFYQAGYDWLGAEQMYGPEETVMSSLRGASRAYNRPLYGSLHAMQWGGPGIGRDAYIRNPQHSLRLFQSLTVAYMHGSSHMNTEEGLWTDEYLGDRYTLSGKQHLYAQQQVLDYIETHTRRGELKSNLAVIQGRNDAWKCFSKQNLWSQDGEKWQFNNACKSFDLLNVFYPENIINSCGDNGFFTKTPYGTIDLLPIEAPKDVMDKYKAILFLGWNTYNWADFNRLKEYVYGGGTLLLTAAHLNAALEPDEPIKFPVDDAPVRELLGEDYQKLKGKNELAFGNGKVIYFADTAYPIEEVIKKDYVQAMKGLAEAFSKNESKRGWIKPVGRVSFTAWDKGDRRTLYLLNIHWQQLDTAQKATLLYGNSCFNIDVRHYHNETIHCAHGLAIRPMGNTSDVLSIKEEGNRWCVKVQTTGADDVQCMNALNGSETVMRCAKAGIHTFFVDK